MSFLYLLNAIKHCEPYGWQSDNAELMDFRILTPRMAPTICVAEFPMAGTTVNALVRRRRGPESGMKRRRFALEEILRTGTVVETLLPPREHSSRRLDYANPNDTVPNCPVIEAEETGEHPTNVDESYRELVVERRKGNKWLLTRYCEMRFSSKLF